MASLTPVDSSHETNVTDHAASQFAASMKDASKPGTGSPESASNGAAAARDLTNPKNPYFYNLATEHDPSYNPTTAKAESFAATLSDYEKRGDYADIAKLLNTLGPSQAAQFFADAGSLQGPQVNGDGITFAKNTGELDQVLGEALSSSRVTLGSDTENGSLAYNLFQLSKQSTSNASSISGILNAAGTNPQVEALKYDVQGYHAGADIAPMTGSPEGAPNGADAARDLTDPNNSYFNNPLFYKLDPGYSPTTAKAESFAATLYDYEKRGDYTDIARLLNTLGPSQAAQFFADAANLQGPQVNGNGVTFATNQAGLDQVLGKALSAPGFALGSDAQKGSLAYSLFQLSTQSASNASMIAGILNAAGTSPQVEALKNGVLSYQAGVAAAKQTPAPGNDNNDDFGNQIESHQNNPEWLAGYFQTLGPQSTAEHLDYELSTGDHGNGFIEDANAEDYVTQAFKSVAPFLSPGFEQALGRSFATTPSSYYPLGGPGNQVAFNAMLDRLDPKQDYNLLINVGKGYMSAAATQTGNQKSIDYALAADLFGKAALDNPAGMTEVLNYLNSQPQKPDAPSFAYTFASEAVQGMEQLAGSPVAGGQPVALPGISPLMIALNQPSAGKTANQLAMQMFYGATNTLFGSPGEPASGSQIKASIPLIQEEGSVGSHTVIVNGKPTQENLGLRTALMDIFRNNAPAILQTWQGGSSQKGGLGLDGQTQFEQFAAFELSPQGDLTVAKNNLDAMFGIAQRFINYSLGANDPAITALVGSNNPRYYAVNFAGWILGSIANEANTAANDLQSSAEAQNNAAQFKSRVFYDWVGLITDVVGLGALGGMAQGIFGISETGLLAKLANLTNHTKTGVGSIFNIPRDKTFIQSDSAIGTGPSITTLPPQDQALIESAFAQAGYQNIDVSSMVTTLEMIYSDNNLPDYKQELDDQFGISGGTDATFAMNPYMNSLDSGSPTTIPSLQDWASWP